MKLNSIFFITFLLLPYLQKAGGAKILFFFAGGTYSHKTFVVSLARRKERETASQFASKDFTNAFFRVRESIFLQVGIWPFVTALADRDHNVTFVSAFQKRPFHHPKVKDLAPSAMTEAMGRQFQNVDRLADRQKGFEKYLLINYHRDILRACTAIFEAIDVEPELHRIFHSEEEDDRFDVIINNAVFGDCGFVLAHRQMAKGTKLIIYDSTNPLFWWPDMYGFPAESAWVPEANNIDQFPMTFVDRLTNYFTSIYWYWRKQYDLFPPLEEMMAKLYNLKNAPSLLEVERNASLILLASHYSLDFARSLPPFFVQVGGMQCWLKEKPLEGEFKEILDNAKDGAILIAFGSTIDLSRMPAVFKNIFFDTVRQFPKLQFIWRWDGPLPLDAPKNLKVATWLPQNGILAHPNTKAFISHAGMNSVAEATYQGKPLILMPLFADQDYNGYRVQAYEIGTEIDSRKKTFVVSLARRKERETASQFASKYFTNVFFRVRIRLEIRTLTTKIMAGAVQEILTNEKYTQNMKKMSAIMRDRPMSPIDSAVYWTEFVLRHEDTGALKPLNQLTMFQRRNWDILLLTALILSIILTLGTVTIWRFLGHLQISRLFNSNFAHNLTGNSEKGGAVRKGGNMHMVAGVRKAVKNNRKNK